MPLRRWILAPWLASGMVSGTNVDFFGLWPRPGVKPIGLPTDQVTRTCIVVPYPRCVPFVTGRTTSNSYWSSPLKGDYQPWSLSSHTRSITIRAPEVGGRDQRSKRCLNQTPPRHFLRYIYSLGPRTREDSQGNGHLRGGVCAQGQRVKIIDESPNRVGSPCIPPSGGVHA